jgi:hypothetical protein
VEMPDGSIISVKKFVADANNVKQLAKRAKIVAAMAERDTKQDQSQQGSTNDPALPDDNANNGVGNGNGSKNKPTVIPPVSSGAVATPTPAS